MPGLLLAMQAVSPDPFAMLRAGWAHDLHAKNI
jgi:hypothetical protein